MDQVLGEMSTPIATRLLTIESDSLRAFISSRLIPMYYMYGEVQLNGPQYSDGRWHQCELRNKGIVGCVSPVFSFSLSSVDCC